MDDGSPIKEAHDVDRSWPLGRAWREAADSGLDMSLIELSLEKTPWQRLLEHDAALRFANELRDASRTLHARS
jgi:hypothetical protein